MNCTFDDRVDAQFAVKHWLQNHVPSDFTLNNMRRLLRDMVQKEKEPVDDMRAEYRERTVGMLRGILEYSREEAENVARMSPSRTLNNAVANLRSAFDMLPSQSQTAGIQIQEAVSQLEIEASMSIERSRQAAMLAGMLLRPVSIS
ncbi:MAG: hypothetical protein ABJA67_03545 [Chthonomonadales bacterium]